MVDREDIRRAVLRTIETIAPDTDVRAIRSDRPLRGQIELDSMDWLNVIAGLQHALAFDIAEADHGSLANATLQAIVDDLAARLAQPSPAPPSSPKAGGGELPTKKHTFNGIAVTVRPMCPQDLRLEADFVAHLSDETRYQRFMLTVKSLSAAKLHYLTDVDQVRHVAFAAIAEVEGRPALVGAARYIVDATATGCEFAVAVADAWQRTGLAGVLMHALIGVARARGLRTMEGFVLAANPRMLKFTRQLGFTQQRDPEDRETVRVVRAL